MKIAAKGAIALVSMSLAGMAGTALGQSREIRIAHVYDKTGPLEAYAKQTQTGLMMGLEFATGGKMEILGRKLVVIEKDSQGKPDVGKAQLGAAYGDDKVDIAVGPTSSGVALAMLPVAEEYKKVLLVEPAVADSITGEKWNRYIFRTGRSSMQDAISNAVAVGKKGVNIATLAQDYAFGRDGVAAFKEALAEPAPPWCTRNTRRRPPPISRRRPSACSTRSRTSRGARSSSSSGPASTPQPR
jgi:branched-chain amino acid transport system substrate-binding protein